MPKKMTDGDCRNCPLHHSGMSSFLPRNRERACQSNSVLTPAFLQCIQLLICTNLTSRIVAFDLNMGSWGLIPKRPY